MKKISVYNQIGPASVGEEEGKMLFKAMEKEIKKGESIILDFAGVDDVSVPFFSRSVGKFIEKDGLDKTSKYIRIENLKNEYVKSIINIAVKFAELKYKEGGKHADVRRAGSEPAYHQLQQ